MFNHLFHFLQEDRFQKGVSDRHAGLLPQTKDSTYLNGYLADRPGGLDREIQYFPTIEAYIQWKQHKI